LWGEAWRGRGEAKLRLGDEEGVGAMAWCGAALEGRCELGKGGERKTRGIERGDRQTRVGLASARQRGGRARTGLGLGSV
jgi:hypothetical protein